MKKKNKKNKKILCISSGGGHWAELIRIRPAFKGFKVIYSSTHPGYEKDISGATYFTINDTNRNQVAGMIITFIQVLWIMIRIWPKIVISTGALPGLIGIMVAKLLGRRTIWLDSIANFDELSMSGKWAKKFSDLYLTQWEHLAKDNGPFYYGKVI